MFDLSRIADRCLVRQIDYHRSIDSTNDRALELAAQPDVLLPLLVLAEEQTRGRGRSGNRWWSTAGALTFSLLLDTPATVLPIEERSRVALVVGLAVCEALEELAPRADWCVKWPNDVYANGAKVCGVLCEAAPGNAARLVVGIGINVNNSLASAGESAATFRARSMIELDGCERDLSDVLVRVLERLGRRWQALTVGRLEEFVSAYRERCLLTGRLVTVGTGAQRVVGACQGIDAAGRLLLATENGPRAIASGTIELWE